MSQKVKSLTHVRRLVGEQASTQVELSHFILVTTRMLSCTHTAC